jgi:hypothetical protein
MKRYKLLNNLFGWVAFAVAAFTYLSTIEPTGSFWDCGEFISTAYKLDVGHPPGAPLFMLAGHFSSLFASDSSQVAAMVNSFSAICSALTILFLFWTITHLAVKIVVKNKETDFTLANIIGIIGAGLVGALAYTFSDTFWFSAVEGEVYGFSSFFTAIVFWLIFKWEANAEETGSDKWLILIAYLMGLSVGVHLLNLLTIPAIVLVYYFKRNEPSVKGVLLTIAVAMAILVFVLYGLIPGFVEVASWFELLFVNKFGLPYNSGLLFYIALAGVALVWAIIETRNEKNRTLATVSFVLAMSLLGIPFLMGSVLTGILVILALVLFFYIKRKKELAVHWLNTIVVMAAVMLIGYGTYGVIVIRSAADPPMDQNSPDNMFTLKSYLNREQYGDRPLFYGQYYNAPPALKEVRNGYQYDMKEGAPVYAQIPKTLPEQKDKYIITGHKQEYVWQSEFCTLFPRMFSRQASHIEEYKSWANMKGKTISYDYAGQRRTEVIPTFGENLYFFLNYQVRYMYFRYFMWNFVGRQNDLAGNGEIDKGNWVSGIKFIDKLLVGENEYYPSELANNKGHNKFYFLPLMLGLLGIFVQLNRGKKGTQSFWITMSLFFLTGLAIVIYLNQAPLQPRERDYAYAGSFYAFCIWIGIGVMGIISLLKKAKLPAVAAATVASVLCLGVPLQMVTQTWDDHDRSNRFAARDFGANYLNSCEPNAIIFCNGDNDTFPLWSNQEVEGVRPDVRVCNLSYIQTDWYIDQMKRPYYESAGLPISWEKKDYISGTNEMVRMENTLKHPIDVQTAFEFIRTSGIKDEDGEAILPSKQLFMPINADSVIATATLPDSMRNEIIPQLNFTFGNGIMKGEMMVLEMINQNKWKRPIYFATTVGSQNYLGLDKNGNFVLEGMVYKVVPMDTRGKITQVNVEKTYDNLMNKYSYGNVGDPKVYSDETVRRMATSHRLVFSNLVDMLIAQGDTARAKKVLDKAFKELPTATIGYDNISFNLATNYYKAGDIATGNRLLVDFLRQNNEYLRWGFSLDRNNRNSIYRDLYFDYMYLSNALRLFQEYNQKELFDKYMPDYQVYAPYFQTPSETEMK